MPKLTETQTIILSRAATRPDNLAMPLPKGLHGAAAKVAVTKMIAQGWLEEVDADLRKCEPLWRETGDDHGTTLIATQAGLAAIGIEPAVARTITNLRSTKPEPVVEPQTAPVTSTIPVSPKPVALRTGTKQAQIIALLQRPEGAAITEIVADTDWKPHSVRGLISGVLKKKLGLTMVTEKVEGMGTVYRIEAS